MQYKHKIKTRFVTFFVIGWSIILIFALVSANSNEPEAKSGKILIEEPSKNGSFFIAANSNENQINSPVLKTKFPFNALFVKWDYKNPLILSEEQLIYGLEYEDGHNFELYVRFLNESWTDWIKMRIDDDSYGKDNSKIVFASQMLPTKLTDSFQYKIIFTSKEAKNNLKNLEFTYLDTTKGPKNSFKISNVSQNDLKIISRAEWGADETYKLDSQGNELWPAEYYTPKKFIIHHTAGERANENPMATIRAIQHWHAASLGWGDIGYNYLIDSQGNIYEGRIGGDGVVGGHAYMRNRNTIGIAILGCYENLPNEKITSTCNTPDQLTEAAQISLNKLIAKKAQEFNIDPLGQSIFHGKMLPNIIGHKDVGNTNCPGNLIYDLLPQSRQLAYNFLQDFGGYKKPLPTAAEFVRQSAPKIDIEETKTGEIVVEFKNTGQAVWRGYEDNYLFVADSGIKNKLARIDSFKIASTSDKDESATISQNSDPVFKLLDGNVYPGEIGKFKLILTPPNNTKTATYNYTLAWQNKGYFPNADFSITVNKIPCTTCQKATNANLTQAINKATLIQSTLPNQMPAETLSPVVIQFQNSGNQTWLKEKLKLHIIYEKIHISPFRNDSWYSEFALIPPKENQIYPGSLATFEFNVKAPHLALPFPHTITLLYEDQEIIKFNHVFEITSPYAAQITANTLPIAVKTTWRPKVKLTFKNTGAKTWTNPTLKSYDIDYTNSWFRDNSWINNKTIASSKAKIEPGQEISFEFRIKPYWQPNTYPHVYKLFDGQTEIQINGKTEFLTYTRVDR
ncbi:MAG TPA: hypothetical protein ENN28_04270 [Candidatus Uhrbacteria bacterium]|nr:hypothetical protein [Candidatus Uhrbacteria bacterium]